ncbi:thioredoxin, partial [Albidovulum sp.]
MLEFGQKNGAPAADLVRDVTEAEFMTEVIEASREVPVIVDFWAPWCGPCKTLGPALEAAVQAARGKVRMAKVNVDENQMIAAQLRVQSIPTVYAFWQGKPVDGFQGAVPASQIKTFVDKLAGLAGDGGLAEALEAADQMLAEGAAVDAAETFAAILAEEPQNPRAYGGLVRAHLALGQADQAEGLLAAVPAAIATAAEVEAARAQLALSRQAANAGPVAELLDRVLARPDDHQARFDLAQALHAGGKVEGAV